MDTAFISRSCTSWCFCKGGSHVVEPKVQPPRSPSSRVPACRMLDGVATWLINGVAAIFFTSLERCSCFYIDTKDDSEDYSHLFIHYEGYGNEAKGLIKGNGVEKNEDGQKYW
ncbi:hypothetical protein SADUNF_Sadunf14G0003500 [Salix dunnii]|uniref:Uncharacterized protein n=1 Tax=Salix dunnii TaxID=1413687 RepID=A0A835MJ54_9ROSI|nr:hypothetical protein SADUNF_Sadunf14G0003500 [Salix dunnii]